MYWQKVGRALEAQETQIVFSSLIFIDLSVFTFLYVLSRRIDDGETQNDDGIWIKLLSSLLTFNMVVFVIEIITSIYSFKMAYFSHYGYVLDFGLTLIVLHDNVSNNASMMSPRRFLFICRMPWRVGRLILTMVQRVEQEHAHTRSKLADSSEESRKALMDVKRFETSYVKEKELRQHAEKMLTGYKDEIDTLREALRIAAMDVAAVAASSSEDSTSNEEQETNIYESPPNNGDEGYYDGSEAMMDNGLDGQIIVDTDGSFDIF
jgi:ribosomal protein L17